MDPVGSGEKHINNWQAHDIIPACYLNSILTIFSDCVNSILAAVMSGRSPGWVLILV
jgi:hypothetical protein